MRGAIDKLEVYRRLGVKEVWIWRKGTIEVFALRGADTIEVFALRGADYERLDSSELLAGLDLPTLLRFVDVRPMTRAVTEYRRALRASV